MPRKFVLHLWKSYKTKEKEVFKLVFNTQRPMISVIQLTKELRTFVKRKPKLKKRICDLLKEAMYFRQKCKEEYVITRNYAQKREEWELVSYYDASIETHEHYLFHMQKFLDEQKRSKVGPAPPEAIAEPLHDIQDAVALDTPVSLSLDKQDTRRTSVTKPPLKRDERLIDKEDFEIFCTMLGILLNDMIKMLEDVLQSGANPSVSDTVSSCIYNEIHSYLAEAQLLAPHWFDMTFLISQKHLFREELIIISGFVRHAEGKDFDFLTKIISQGLKIPPSIIPPFITNLYESIRYIMIGKSPDFHTFQCSMWLYILRKVDSIQQTNKQKFETLKSDTLKKLGYLGDVMAHPIVHQFMLGDIDVFCKQVVSFQSLIPQLTCFPMICTISMWIEIHLHEVFRPLLERPLICMTAHLYVFMRLSKTIEPIERLEVFCEKHGNMLFWNNQPNNQAEWNESFLQWALPRSPQKASTIARRRHERTYSLFRQLAQNKFRLTSELIKDLDDQSEQAIFNSLKLKLDQEEPPMDTYLLYNILCEMAKEGRTADNMTEEEATAYLSIIIAKARGASRSGSDAGNGPARDFLAEASSRWMDQEAAGVN